MVKNYDEIDVEAAAGRVASGKNPDGSDFFVVAGAVTGTGQQVSLKVDESGALYITDGSGGMTIDGTGAAVVVSGFGTVPFPGGGIALTVDGTVSVDAITTSDGTGAAVVVSGFGTVPFPGGGIAQIDRMIAAARAAWEGQQPAWRI